MFLRMKSTHTTKKKELFKTERTAGPLIVWWQYWLFAGYEGAKCALGILCFAI